MITQETDLLTLDEVLAITKIARATLYKMMELHGFPRPVKLGRSNRWLKKEVLVWLAQRPRARVQTNQPVAVGR